MSPQRERSESCTRAASCRGPGRRLQRKTGVLAGHLHETARIAPGRGAQPEGPAPALAQISLEGLLLGYRHRNQRHLGDVPRPVVEPGQELSEQFVLVQSHVEGVGLARGQLALAIEEHHHLGEPSRTVHPQHVHVVELHVLHLLAPGEGLERGDAVAQAGGLLVVEPFRGLPHLGLEAGQERLGLALENGHGPLEVARVIRLRNPPHARRGTPADLVLDAGAGAVRELPVPAIPQGDHGADGA